MSPIYRSPQQTIARAKNQGGRQFHDVLGPVCVCLHCGGAPDTEQNVRSLPVVQAASGSVDADRSQWPVGFPVAEALIISLAEASPVLVPIAGTAFASITTIMVVAISCEMMTGRHIQPWKF